MRIGQYQLIQATPVPSTGYKPPQIQNLVGQLPVGSILALPTLTGLPPGLLPRFEFKLPSQPKDQSSPPTPTASSKDDDKPTRITLGHVVTNVGIGTTFAGGSIEAIKIINTTDPQHLAALLQSYNVSPDAAKFVADNSINYARSNMGKIVCVFAASTGLAIGVIEAIKPDWAWKKKVGLAAVFGLAMVILVVVLAARGVFQNSKGDPNQAVPSAAAPATH